MLRIAFAQDDFRVGHVTANRDLILKLVGRARDEQRADLIVFPELALTGYPPEDLLLRPGFMRRAEEAFREIVAAVDGIDVVLPWPRCKGADRYNSAAWIRDRRVLAVYDKWELPNYAVFDEQRYFISGRKPMVVELGGLQVGVVICEDTWSRQAVGASADAGADIIISTNASPFYRGKHVDRGEMLKRRNAESGLPLIYLNCVGGQDELVFDGHSAELAPGQKDQDSLPPYEILDSVIEAYVERDESILEIVESTGIAEATVRRVAGMVLAAEFKRRQGAPGPRITRKAFGRDRRYPITSGWHDSGVRR